MSRDATRLGQSNRTFVCLEHRQRARGPFYSRPHCPTCGALMLRTGYKDKTPAADDSVGWEALVKKLNGHDIAFG